MLIPAQYLFAMSHDELHGYHVSVKDNWVGIDNFYTIEATSEEEARETFEEEYRRHDQQEIVDVEVAYSFDLESMRTMFDLFDVEEPEYVDIHQ